LREPRLDLLLKLRCIGREQQLYGQQVLRSGSKQLEEDHLPSFQARVHDRGRAASTALVALHDTARLLALCAWREAGKEKGQLLLPEAQRREDALLGAAVKVLGNFGVQITRWEGHH